MFKRFLELSRNLHPLPLVYGDAWMPLGVSFKDFILAASCSSINSGFNHFSFGRISIIDQKSKFS